MEAQISDFALAKKSLELLCYQFDREFVDVSIVFGEEGPEYRDNIFYLQENGSLRKTIFSIVFLYLQYFMDNVPDEARREAMIFVLALVRDFTNSDKSYGFESMNLDEIIPMRLDNFPLPWILLKNIICPSRGSACKNYRVLSSKSSVVDVARLITEKEMPNVSLDKDEFPFIFMNLDVESEAIRYAYMLVEATRAHFGDESESIIRDLFANFFMKDRIISFVQMAFLDERDEADFFATLSILCQSEELEQLAIHGSSNTNVKQAQYEGNTNNWWFLGLIEKMLEPARSEDWTVYKRWKPFTEELWQRVETERRNRGLDEAPFELLLDVQREMDELTTDGSKTLQALLSEDRIW